MSETISSITLEVDLRAPSPSKGGGSEYRAFLGMLPHLLKSHRGQHVAVYEGRVVDADTDEIALIQRVHAQIGYVPIYFGLVTEQPVIARVPHRHGGSW